MCFYVEVFLNSHPPLFTKLKLHRRILPDYKLLIIAWNIWIMGYFLSSVSKCIVSYVSVKKFVFLPASQPFHGCMWNRSVKSHMGFVPAGSWPISGVFPHTCNGHKWQVSCLALHLYFMLWVDISWNETMMSQLKKGLCVHVYPAVEIMAKTSTL